MVDVSTIQDIQSAQDIRQISINKVGVKGVKHPIIFADLDANGQTITQAQTAILDLYVNLPKNLKGTHMSRFIELINESTVTLSVKNMPTILDIIATKLEANNAYLSASFDYFIQKTAPISKAKSLMDYQVIIDAKLANAKTETLLTVKVPVTSLCPCSKAISEFGAHNQRSEIIVTANITKDFSLIKLINLIEQQASCDLYGILKRVDEKFVTERAYQNPKFVEDLVRDLAIALEKLPTILGFSVSSENFESIHNHSAYALIEKF